MKVPSYFWDSCVFIEFLTGGDRHAADIRQYIEEAAQGKCAIYHSSITLAEIKPSHLKSHHGYGTYMDFINDFQGAFVPISPTPNILIQAGALRDKPFPCPNGGKSRPLDTADAIHLTTCLFARDSLGLSDIVFHTFDAGRGKVNGERQVPIIGFEDWAEPFKEMDLIKQVCSIPRTLPIHPHPTLFHESGGEKPHGDAEDEAGRPAD